jgi:hypothetical protein
MGEQPEMKSYLVTWKIDIDADTPEEAACTALIIQRDNDPANTATIHCANARWTWRSQSPARSRNGFTFGPTEQADRCRSMGR